MLDSGSESAYPLGMKVASSDDLAAAAAYKRKREAEKRDNVSCHHWRALGVNDLCCAACHSAAQDACEGCGKVATLRVNGHAVCVACADLASEDDE